MSLANLKTYLDCVRKSRLIEDDRLKQVLDTLASESGEDAVDAILFASRLVQDQLLTPWQNERLLAGRWQGFFFGKYKLLSHLGAGGMSTVYLAEHTAMRRRVAIKVLSSAQAKNQNVLERFLRESRAVASLNHPNIVRAYEVDNHGEMHYLVLEYVPGKDLEKLVEGQGPLAYEQAADYIAQAAEGLACAHDRGIVHRDIKPSNLLVDPQGTVKVLDMGIARLDHEGERAITIEQTGTMLGTADYLPPEQAMDSHHIDHRADIYALGCTLYYLLTGHPPFQEGTLAERLLKHMTLEPTTIYQDRPDAPQPLVEICRRMMRKKPDERFQKSKDVADVLRAWLAGDSTVTTIPAGDARLGVGNAQEPEADEETVQPPRDHFAVSEEGSGHSYGAPEARTLTKNKMVWIAAAGAVLLTTPIALWAFPRGSQTDKGPERPAARGSFVDRSVTWNGKSPATPAPAAKAPAGSALAAKTPAPSPPAVPSTTPAQPFPPGWQYGYGEFDNATGRLKQFHPFTYSIGGRWHKNPVWPEPTAGSLMLTASNGHPGNGPTLAVVRRWKADKLALVSVAGQLQHPKDGGNGVRARISSSRHGLLGSYASRNNRIEVQIADIEVAPGDTLDFVVDDLADASHDSFNWAPVVRIVKELATPEEGQEAQLLAAVDLAKHAPFDGQSAQYMLVAIQRDEGPGLIEIEAEHFHRHLAIGEHQWVVVEDGKYSGGAAMHTREHSGYYEDPAKGPRLAFQIRFARTGKHYLRVRGHHAGESSNSFHAMFDGKPVAALTNIAVNSSEGEWSHRNSRDGLCEFDVSSKGVHAVVISMREDGFTFDKLLITSDPDYQPADSTPPEPPRSE